MTRGSRDIQDAERRLIDLSDLLEISQTLNQSLFSLYARRLITLEEAMGRSNDAEELQMMIEKRGGR